VPDLSKKPARYPVRTLAINFGAPGSRRAPDGRFWLNQHAQAMLKVSGSGLYCRHSHAFTGDLPWVAASGCRGIAELEIDLGRHRKDPPAVCTVRLHFADPDNADEGKRVFDVHLDGKPLLTGFDIAKEAGAARKALIKEFRGIVADGKLKFVFAPTVAPAAGASLPDSAVPLLNGIEILVEPPTTDPEPSK